MMSNEDDCWSCECCLELFIDQLSIGEALRIFPENIDNICVIDESVRGWGVGYASDKNWIGDRRKISIAIVEFLNALATIIAQLPQGFKGLLRIGIFHSTYEFTLRLDKNVFDFFGDIDLELEVSIFPS